MEEAGEIMGRASEEEEKDEKDEYDDYVVARMALVHLIISDRADREIGRQAFAGSVNIWKIRAPFVEEEWGGFHGCRNFVDIILPNVNTVERRAFQSWGARPIGHCTFTDCHDLLHITLHPNVEVGECAFYLCLSLRSSQLPPTSRSTIRGHGITHYLLWRNCSM